MIPNPLPDSMFPDRVDVHASTTTTARDPSGGRAAPEATVVSGVACSLQPASENEVLAARSLGYSLETKVYFKADPGDLKTGARLHVVSLGAPPAAADAWLTVQRKAREGVGPLVVYRLDCQGRA